MYHWSWVQLLSPVLHAVENLLLSLDPSMGADLAHSRAIVVLSTWVVSFVLIGLALVGRAGLNKARARGGSAQYLSDSTLTVRNFFEMFVQAMIGLAGSTLPKEHIQKYFPLIGTLFLYIIFNNYWAIIPGGIPPTDNLNNNAAMAIVVFLVFNYVGITSQGMGYFKHMCGPVLALAPFIFVIELIGLFVRPASLTLRLMGNMTGDHMVFGVMSDLVPAVIPSLFLGLGMFVCFLQAFVFTILSVVYIALSLPQHDH